MVVRYVSIDTFLLAINVFGLDLSCTTQVF